MSINLIEVVQKNLGYPALQKIDPNTQEKDINDVPAATRFSQASIPAVLTALYRFVQTDEGAAEFLSADHGSHWASKIFDENSSSAVQTIASYAKECGKDANSQVNEIANETVKVVKEKLGDGAGVKEVKDLFNDQRNNILLYLPPHLNMGNLLHDNTLDDNVNKMEGPVSSLIKNIGNAFSKPVTDEEIKEQ
jgi:hypothetical protein